jgi:4-amino-4-deoxy-L-arabinose transferase-like glycosyltransferase
LSFRLFEPDEGRYAEIPREMLLRGEWIVPHLLGEPYLDKPPLLYWLVMGSYRCFGVYDWSARLVPALAMHATILLTYVLGRRFLGDRAAFWAAVALCLAPGFVSIGRLLVMDGLLALWVTVAMFAAYEAVRGPRLRWSWWLLSATACGLGVLTKGPVILILVLPPVWLFRWLSGRNFLLRWPCIVSFAAVVAAVALPWYLLICWRMPSFAGYFLWEQNVVRFVAPFDHLRPVWFYLPIMLAGFLPASLLVVPFLRFLVSSNPDTAQRRSKELAMMLIAGGWCFFFFSMSGCKLPTYILPVFPPIALALGYFLTQSAWFGGRAFKSAAVGMALVVAFLHFVGIPAYARYHSPLGQPQETLLACRRPDLPLVCYPRNCDSVAFYLGREDVRSFRSTLTASLVDFLTQHPRTVVLFTHRHSLETLRPSLPAELRLTGEKALCIGDCWVNRLFAGIRRSMGETREELYHVAVAERRLLPAR